MCTLVETPGSFWERAKYEERSTKEEKKPLVPQALPGNALRERLCLSCGH
jgi:hypothetical protein